MSTYTEKQTEELKKLYLTNPCLEMVDKLSVQFNRPRKSIISKLVKEGVYQKLGYRDKRGELPITKLALVRELEQLLGVDLIDLQKTPKSTLKILLEKVKLLSDDLETALLELGDLSEVLRVKDEMLNTKCNTY